MSTQKYVAKNSTFLPIRILFINLFIFLILQFPRFVLMSMHKRLTLYISFLIYGLISGCSNEHKQDKQTIDPRNLQNEKSARAFQQAGDVFKRIMLSPTLVARNQQWNTPISAIQESIEPSESTTETGKTYSLYFDNTDLNFVDIRYIPDTNNKLVEIDLDIYVDDKKDVDPIQSDFKRYFSTKYGQPKINGKQYTWIEQKNTRVILEDISSQKDPGIKIVLSRLD